jgi:putative OmpL-like beta-barrel porin-2
MLALGIVGAQAARAENRMAAGGAGGASETTATSAASASSSPTASSPADLRQRIDALKAELTDLNTELAAEKDVDSATSAAAPQAQGSTMPAMPPQAATPAPAAAAPAPLPSPSMAGPLATGIPHELPAGPFGKIEVTGVLSGMGWTEGDYVPFQLNGSPESPTHWDLSNAQIFIQKTTGWFQFFLQAGAYNLPAVGTPFFGTPDTVKGFYGPFPQGYVKLVKGNFNVEVGALPTLIGAEYTFTYENMNIERGLLWNQENAVNRGVQLNDTYKKLTVAFSWNDGFYSNRYNWLSGSLTYAINASNTLAFVGMGNAGAYARVSPTSFATPTTLNNSQIYNLLYTYTKGPVTINPYFQYTVVKANPSIGIPVGAHTNGGALLANYNFKHGISLSVRPEYIKSSGPNLLYGPSTGAFAFTVTPTYVKDAFFLRGDISVVHVTNFNSTTGFAFGVDGTKLNQPRGVIEAGFMF